MLLVELVCDILFLLPKLCVNIRRIGLLEVIWKVVEATIETRIKTVMIFHNVLHGFRSSIGMRTDMMELKMA